MNRMLLSVLFTVSTGCVIHVDTITDSDTLTFAEAVDEVRYDLSAGDLDVSVGDVTEVTVIRTWRWSGDRPYAEARVEGGRLVVEVDCEHQPFGSCSVDHEILLPAPAEVYGSTGAGNVSLVGMISADATTGAGDVFALEIPGWVSIYTGSGEVELDEIGGDLDVETGSGDVFARDLTSTWIWASTGSGDVDLEVEVVPDTVTLVTGSGDVTLEVPAGTYDVSTHTGSGDVDVNGITTSSSAASHIDVETGSGDVTIYAE